MIGFVSCGGNDGHSKAFRESKKILDNIKTQINKASDCDAVDMAAFGILGLFGVEGIDEMSEAEQEELSKLSDEIDKVMEDRYGGIRPFRLIPIIAAQPECTAMRLS